MKLSVILQMIAIKPKYKTKWYYKKCVAQKTLETKHKTLHTKHYYLKVLHHSLVREQYLYIRAKPGGIALNYLLCYSFLASFGRKPERISMVQFSKKRISKEYHVPVQ